MAAPLVNVDAYRQGVYAPVDREVTARELPVEGTLPPALHGLFAQNNPNPRFEPPGFYHWFDGDGMVHGVWFEDGRATYRNRWIETRGLAQDLAAGRAETRGILEPFTPGDSRPDKDTANTDLVWHGGKLLALWWLGGDPVALSVPELETLAVEDFAGTLGCGVAAHPKVDPRTGEMIFMDYCPYAEPHLGVGVVSPQGRVTLQQPIPVPGPSLFHDLAITPDHTILMDLPMVWDPRKLAEGKRRVRFQRDQPARFGVLPRHGGDVRWFEASTCYSYHTVNAYEERDGHQNTVVVLTGCRIEDPIPTRPHTDEPHIPRLAFLRLEPYLHEWRFNLGTGAVSERRLGDAPTEFPRMDDRFLGVATRLSWHPRVAREPTLLFDGCVRYDLGGGETREHVYGPGVVGGETVFAPRPGGSAEGDGWVLVYENDRREGTSALLVLDAETLDFVARVRLPARVPVGFHAHWVPGEEV